MPTPRQAALLSGGYCAEALAVFAAMTTAPDAARKRLINALIVSLKSSGVWSLLDSLYILAAADSQAARVDWKRPSVTATVTNSPTFTADRGYAFDGSTNYLNTNFTPSTNAVAMTGTDILMGLREFSNVASSTTGMGGADSTSGRSLLFTPRGSGGQFQGRLNCATTTSAGATTATSQCLLILQRPNNTNLIGYKQGAAVAAEQALLGTVVSTLGTQPIYVGCLNSNGSPTSYRANSVSVAMLGASWSASQHVSANTAIEAYLTAVGVT